MDMALRPMSISQVLDRTFFLYRNNLVLFAGIAVITPALKLVVSLALLKIFGQVMTPTQPEHVTPEFFQAVLVRAVIGGGALIIISIVGTAIASSATAFAVSMVHLGKTTTIAESYHRVKPILGRVLWLTCQVLAYTIGPIILCYVVFIGLAFGMVFVTKGGNASPSFAIAMLALALGGLGLLFGAIVWSLYALCRYSLAVPACVLENLSAGNAMRRSTSLSNGTRWGILGIIFLTGIISVSLTLVLQMPAWIASGAAIFSAKGTVSIAATIWVYLAEFVGGTIAGPIATIALALVYYDQRVRKEAFDLQMMMEALGRQVPPPTAVAAPPLMG